MWLNAVEIGLCLLALAVLAGLVALIRFKHRSAVLGGRGVSLSGGDVELCRSLLEEARSGGQRYQVILHDFGPDHRPADMRWQYAVFDADRNLRSGAYRRKGADPQGSVGVEEPYWVGNAPDEQDALLTAVAWVQQAGAPLVLVPLPLREL